MRTIADVIRLRAWFFWDGRRLEPWELLHTVPWTLIGKVTPS